MTDWMLMINPSSPLRDEGAARIAAGASTPALVISGFMSAVAAALMSQQVDVVKVALGEEARRVASSSPQTSAALQGLVENGLVELGVGLMAAWAVIQIALAAWHWRRRGSFIPIVFLILLAYRIGDQLLGVFTGSDGASPLTIASILLLSVCLLLHAVALRGVSRLTALRNAA